MKNKKKAIIFGASNCGVEFYNKNKHRYEMVGFVDNDRTKKGTKLFGCEIYEPLDIYGLDYDKIIICSTYHAEIYHQLAVELHLDERKITHYSSEVNDNFLVLCKTKSLEKLKYLMMLLSCKNIPIISRFVFYLLKINIPSINIMPCFWLDKQSESIVEVLEESILQTVYSPKNGELNNSKNIIVPTINLYNFKNAIIRSGSRSIIIDDKVVIERVETSVDEKNNSYIGGQLLFEHNGKSLIKVNELISIDSGSWISSYSDTNYFHWLIEALSQFEYLNRLDKKYKNIPILISSKARDIAAIKTFVSHLYDGKLVYLNPESNYMVKELMVISTPNGFVPNKYKGGWDVTDCYARETSIHYIRRIGLEILSTCDVNINPIRKIFLARKGVLRKYNQPEVFELLSKYGFQSVYMEDLSLVEQVSIINNAEYIVGPTGAAWTNIIFANAGSKALCWMAKEAGEFSCFSNLAAIVGVDMDYIYYSSGTNDSRKIYNREYSVNLDDIEKWLLNNVS